MSYPFEAVMQHHRIGVACATYGSEEWKLRGEHAMRSLRHQTSDTDAGPMGRCHIHGEELAVARNEAVMAVESDWVIVLDADDRLDDRYIAAMRAARMVWGDEPKAIFRPATRGFHPEQGLLEPEAVMIPRTDMAKANCIVIGAMFPKSLFVEVGGFDRRLKALEDWELWLRMLEAGAKVIDVADAEYHVEVNLDSRNKNRRHHADAYRQIRVMHRGASGLDLR